MAGRQGDCVYETFPDGLVPTGSDDYDGCIDDHFARARACLGRLVRQRRRKQAIHWSELDRAHHAQPKVEIESDVNRLVQRARCLPCRATKEARRLHKIATIEPAAKCIECQLAWPLVVDGLPCPVDDPPFADEGAHMRILPGRFGYGQPRAPGSRRSSEFSHARMSARCAREPLVDRVTLSAVGLTDPVGQAIGIALDYVELSSVLSPSMTKYSRFG
jgi:hypothetical protein